MGGVPGDRRRHLDRAIGLVEDSRPQDGDLAEGGLEGEGSCPPPLDAGLLPGITREFIFEIGNANGISVREAVLRDDDLYGADEAFLTSTTREAVPVVTVDDRAVGNGTPGPVTLKLLEEFRRAARSPT